MEARKQPESAWTRAAKRRFLFHTIIGDGPFCLVDDTRGRVELFEFELFAQDEFSKRGSGSRLLTLQPDYGASFNSQNGRLRVSAETIEFRK